MGKFTVIPQDTFKALQLNAGVLLKTFNPAAVAEPEDKDIICATTGGITVSCTPTFTDLGADIDNCPKNTKELLNLESYDCKMSFTALDTSPESIKLSIGCADIEGTTKIVPRAELAQTDFSDIWWAGDRADGGCVAIQLKNALSTGGFSLKTTDKGTGDTSVELTGYVSIEKQKEVPMVFYSIDPAGE